MTRWTVFAALLIIWYFDAWHKASKCAVPGTGTNIILVADKVRNRMQKPQVYFVKSQDHVSSNLLRKMELQQQVVFHSITCLYRQVVLNIAV